MKKIKPKAVLSKCKQTKDFLIAPAKKTYSWATQPETIHFVYFYWYLSSVESVS